MIWRLNITGNFIKPTQGILFCGTQAEASGFKKSEKGWRDDNYFKRYWLGSAWLVSWSAICVIWRTLHNRPWNRIGILAITRKKRNDNA